ncbi:hypothetical protein ASPCAL06086 [Aspergillus calidoustus]|uniref:Cellulose-binding protein n=1 Tax=Aspergillus calidoustus TaxID=454130 RepID=A0A0U5GVI1_ASPCI|nr:hypothetical protein ASPCAL06086 [Aspergillus calidoustus]
MPWWKTTTYLALLAPLYLQLSSQTKCILAAEPKPRLFILSDIANEPDDAQSFVRLMVYANEFQIEGLVATTSIWLNDTTRPDLMHEIVDAYGASLPKLRNHAGGWPEAAHLKALIASGLSVYGMDGVGEGKDSDGSNLLVNAVDASDEPLWIPIWGGASVLAQALWQVNATRSPAEIQLFVSKVRAYAISDQDNTGTWIRRHWPRLFYIASVHHFNRYAVAAWGGMSGEMYYHFPSGADAALVSPEWVREHIQSAGALGEKYPDAEFILEGDTPSLLYMIPNGLSDPEHPEWGSWGGRYGPVTFGEGHFADSVDTIVGSDERTMMGSHVTVWRWREAAQREFAARMRWGVTPQFNHANHAPVAVVNGIEGRHVIKMIVQAGEEVNLDASASCDPDGRDLTFKWWQYKEPSSNNNNPRRDVAELGIDSRTSATVKVRIPSDVVLRQPGRNAHPDCDKHLHLILEVSDGELVAYRRVIFTILGPRIRQPKVIAQGHDEL